MSVKMTNMVWEARLRPEQKHLLHALADQADDDGYVIYRKGEEATKEFWAWKTGYSERTIQRQMAELMDPETGLLEIVTPATHHRPPEYRIRVDMLAALNRITRGDRLSPLKPCQGRQIVSPEPCGKPVDKPESGETSTTVRGDIHDSQGRHPRQSGETYCLPTYKVLYQKAPKGTSGERPHPRAVAQEKATAALEELTDRLASYRDNGTALVIQDSITLAVMHHDLGGRDAVLKLARSELEDRFPEHYVRRELAAWRAGRNGNGDKQGKNRGP